MKLRPTLNSWANTHPRKTRKCDYAELHQIPQTQLNFFFCLSVSSKETTAKNRTVGTVAERWKKTPRKLFGYFGCFSSLCQKQVLKHFSGWSSILILPALFSYQRGNILMRIFKIQNMYSCSNVQLGVKHLSWLQRRSLLHMMVFWKLLHIGMLNC